MNYEKMNAEVKKLIDDTETKMFKLIEDYNESISKEDYENLEVSEVDTVDLSNLFIIFARKSPFCSSWCIKGRDTAVMAVSTPEKKAESSSKIKMILKIIYKLVTMLNFL